MLIKFLEACIHPTSPVDDCLGSAILDLGQGGRKTIFKAGGARVKSHRAINGQIPPERGKSNVSQFIASTSCQCQGVCVEIMAFFVVVVIVFVYKTIFCEKFLFLGKGGEQYYLELFASQFFNTLPHTYPVVGVGQGVHPCFLVSFLF